MRRRATGVDVGEDGLALRLTVAARVLHRRTAERLRHLDLHPGQERLLAALAELGPSSASRLAAALDVEKPTVVRAVGRLEKSGHVSRRRGGHDDPRVVLVELTDEGRELHAAANAVTEALEGQLRSALSPIEAATLEELLERLELAIRPSTNGTAGPDGAS